MPEETFKNSPLENVVIACGGTGGHLFPGLAVGQELRQRGCAVTLMVSPKDVDHGHHHPARGWLKPWAFLWLRDRPVAVPSPR